MSTALWTAIILSLAAASLFGVAQAWPDRRKMISRSLALLVGVVLSLLQFGWPQGLTIGLAAGSAAPVILGALPKIVGGLWRRNGTS